jgi:hypothetical protein
MSAEHRRKCSVCGREFSGGKAFCPVCMLRAAAYKAFDVDLRCPVALKVIEKPGALVLRPLFLEHQKSALCIRPE